MPDLEAKARMVAEEMWNHIVPAIAKMQCPPEKHAGTWGCVGKCDCCQKDYFIAIIVRHFGDMERELSTVEVKRLIKQYSEATLRPGLKQFQLELFEPVFIRTLEVDAQWAVESGCPLSLHDICMRPEGECTWNRDCPELTARCWIEYWRKEAE